MDGRPDFDDLFHRAQAGDERAIEDLVAHAWDWLCRWGHGRLPHWARDGFSTADLAQMTVWRFLQVLQRFEPGTEDALRNFLAVVFRNAIRDEIRRIKRCGNSVAEEILLDLPDPSPSPLDDLLSKRAVGRMLRAFPKLSRREQELLSVDPDDTSYADIAARMGLPTADAARKAVKRARDHLRELMEEE